MVRSGFCLSYAAPRRSAQLAIVAVVARPQCVVVQRQKHRLRTNTCSHSSPEQPKEILVVVATVELTCAARAPELLQATCGASPFVSERDCATLTCLGHKLYLFVLSRSTDNHTEAKTQHTREPRRLSHLCACVQSSRVATCGQLVRHRLGSEPSMSEANQ